MSYTTLSFDKSLCMTPINILWKELLEIAPSLQIHYDAKNDKTCVSNADICVSEAENLPRAIILAWLYYYKGKTDDR